MRLNITIASARKLDLFDDIEPLSNRYFKEENSSLKENSMCSYLLSKCLKICNNPSPREKEHIFLHYRSSGCFWNKTKFNLFLN